MQFRAYAIRRKSNPTEFLSRPKGNLKLREWTDDEKRVDFWPHQKNGPAMTLNELKKVDCTWNGNVSLEDCEIVSLSVTP